MYTFQFRIQRFVELQLPGNGMGSSDYFEVLKVLRALINSLKFSFESCFTWTTAANCWADWYMRTLRGQCQIEKIEKFLHFHSCMEWKLRCETLMVPRVQRSCSRAQSIGSWFCVSYLLNSWITHAKWSVEYFFSKSSLLYSGSKHTLYHDKGCN